MIIFSGLFLHRSAFRGCMYEKQTYLKNGRQQFKIWGKLFESEKVYEEMYSKHFRKQYAGKPTKRYLKLWKKLSQAGEASAEDIVKYLR